MGNKSKRNARLAGRLQDFAEEQGMTGKGGLSVALCVTRRVRELSPPYDHSLFLTKKKGQVKGLGKSRVQAVLRDHGIERVLAEEGGRTSRGSLGLMQQYIGFLNRLHSDSLLDLDYVERWWIERVREYFASQPLKLKADSSKSLRYIIAELMQAAFERQRQCTGTMVAGAVIQHLVGAKLNLALPDAGIQHEGFSVADAPLNRKGDFHVGNTAIHVTTAPTEALMRKCKKNLAEGLRPLIVTTQQGAGGGEALAKNSEIGERIDILEIEQFIATNIYEWTGFHEQKRGHSIEELVAEYNKIILACESDQSLQIAIG